MIDFLIKSTICLTVFLGFYHLVLEREKMHQFNRYYLLISIVISLVIPFVTFEIIEIIPAVQNTESLIIDTIPITSTETAIQEKTNYIPIILWSLYSLISSILIIRFGKNSWKLISKTISNPKVKYKNANLILIDEKTLPHTFLNFIYINFEDYNNRNIEDELYTHELVHVTQKHTLDILFIEFLKVIFWFNPIFIFYKKAIQLNHEFLADEEIVKTYNNVPFYQNLLLQKGIGTQTIYLASNLNYLVTKKRLIMMTKSTSQKIATIKKIAIAPIMAVLIYFFCIEIIAQEKDNKQIIKPISTDKIQNLSDNDKIRDAYYKGVWVKITDENANKKISSQYENLSLEDKRKYLSFVPKQIVENKISENLFEKMKKGNMAVWIDEKVKNKNEINKYNYTDIVHFNSSFVYKNARSKRFPQEYQYSLYTKEYFDKNLKNSHNHFSGDTIRIGISSRTKVKKYSTQSSDSIISSPTVKKEGIEIKKIEDKKEIEKLNSNIVNKLSDFDTKDKKEGYIYMNNATYFFVKDENGEIEYYNRWGNRVNENGEKIEKK